jgi:c-di-GMP-binding flagellar brake protein YcgR
MSADDGLDEFRVSSTRDVGTLLKQLLDGSVLLNLNGSDGRVFTSAIWTLDTTRGTIGFNADPNDPAMQSVLHSREVTVVGYLESVKVQFDVQNLVLVHGNKASVLSCPFPREMFRFQRRNAFRVRPLMRSAPTAKLRHPDMPDTEFSLRVIDISIGGCALFLPDDVPMMNAGVVIGGVRMEPRRRHQARRQPAPAARDLAEQRSARPAPGLRVRPPGRRHPARAAALHRPDAEARETDGAQLSVGAGARLAAGEDRVGSTASDAPR